MAEGTLISEHFGILPDILLMAKGIASGLPLSALATTQALMERWKPGRHGGTFGGNAISCAAAVATIQVMKEERLIENAAARGKQLMSGLTRLQKEFKAIGDVRGLGLMVATEFSKNGEPDAETTKAVVQAAFEQNLMLLTYGTYDNAIRWIPPLVVTADQIDQALEIFAAALDRVAS
ncbi:MAG: aminotransferase class III-fold pyridoxal phosphate-dependent enzyme [Chloroflexi bacterium]|nr:aminotransferase class III-fold pyridoxal phosphate-dependent enzyme [Chloroflexota bacterium]